MGRQYQQRQVFYKLSQFYINPFFLNAPFPYPLKTSENLKSFLMFSGGRERVHWERKVNF